jgi:exodeoxyribonuclease-3
MVQIFIADLHENPISHESNQSNAAITKSVVKKIQMEAGDKTNPQDDKCLGPKQKKKKKQRGQDDLPDLAEYTADADEVGDPPSKRKKRESLPKRILSALTETNGENYPWTILVHRKPQPHWVAYNPALMRPSPPATSDNTMKLLSWNVNGLRALLKEKGVEHAHGSLIARLALREDFDILCLQETKLQVSKFLPFFCCCK